VKNKAGSPPLNFPNPVNLKEEHRRIYLVRHGQTEFNREGKIQGRGIDAPLNDFGRLQSRQLNEVFRDFHFDLAVTSSMKRARQTLEELELKSEPHYFKFSELDEINFGVFEGRKFTEIEPDLNHLQQVWRDGKLDIGAESGESPQQVLERARPVVRSVLREREGRHFLFILHGRLMRILLADWLYGDLSRMQEIHHSNTGIWVLDIDSEGLVVEVLARNFTDHLEKTYE
jgi:probable phosphoglycerate mutase